MLKKIGQENLLKLPTHSVFVDDEGGDRPPVIFQHGLGGDAKQADAVFPKDPRWRRITLECQGHGKTPLQEIKKLSISAFTDDLRILISQYINDPIIIGGISMGAAISLKITVDHPEQVRALILVRPAWISKSNPKNLKITRLVAQLLRKYSPESAYSKFVQYEQVRKLEKDSPDNLLSFKSYFSRKNPEVIADLLGIIGADGPEVTEKQIKGIKIPTLILATARDVVHPLEYAESLKTLIKNSRIIIVTSKSDNPYQYIADVRDAIRIFIEEHIS